MRRFTQVQVLLASTLLVGAFAVTSGAAAASPKDYRAGMPGLLQDVKIWVQDVEMTADAALTKPELACDAHMADLARRGQSIAADLVGTGRHAPAALAGAHNDLTASVARITVSVENACGDSQTTLQTVQAEKPGQSRAMFRIANFVTRAFANNGGW